MIDITIDDKKISAKENQTILQVAKENRIKIPHLCFHPALKPSGSCKLCSVEVASPTGKQVVMLSCIMKVKEGLKVKTNSDLVKAKREKACNKLLQMAPESSRIRDIAKEFNIAIAPPPDGCIRCRLCIRVCNEIVKAKALKMEKTTQGSMVVPQIGRCIGCGTCANLCPTKIIKVVDQDNVRTVSIKDEVIGQLPLERCEGCGTMFATTTFLEHVGKVTFSHPDTKEHHNLCASCTKLMSNRAKTERDRIKKMTITAVKSIFIGVGGSLILAVFCSTFMALEKVLTIIPLFIGFNGAMIGYRLVEALKSGIMNIPIFSFVLGVGAGALTFVAVNFAVSFMGSAYSLNITDLFIYMPVSGITSYLGATLAVRYFNL